MQKSSGVRPPAAVHGLATLLSSEPSTWGAYGVMQIQSQKTEKAGDKICSCFHLFFSHWIFITGQEETLRTLSQDRGLGGESSSSPSKT